MRAGEGGKEGGREGDSERGREVEWKRERVEKRSTE
jgi:hypothetical protein